MLAGQDRPLAEFARYLDRIDAQTVTIAAALAWAVEPETTPLRHYQRLAMVRGFAAYLHAIDPGCEIPPKDLLPEGRRRVPPHIDSDEEIAVLMRASRLLRPAFRAATIETAIGLLGSPACAPGSLSVSSEAMSTSHRAVEDHRHEVQEVTGVGSSSEDRGGPRRLWPRARALLAAAPSLVFFLSSQGARLSQAGFERSFAWLVDQTGLAPPPGSRARRPRLHDVRHSFAVATLLRRHRDGLDVQSLLPALSAQLGHADPASRPVFDGAPEPLAVTASASNGPRGRAMTAAAPAIQAFFLTRLGAERDASRHTIDSYRHAFRFRFAFAKARTGKSLCELDIADLDAGLVSSFLDHLESGRSNTVGTRNTRLAAIHSFFRFASYRHPEHAHTIGQVLAIPQKRAETFPRCYLTEAEMGALIAAPDRTTWSGRRDHALLVTALRTGMRLSELTGLRCQDAQLRSPAHIKCLGKGRKRRDIPIDKATVAALRVWLIERRGEPDDPLFVSRRRSRLSANAVQRLVAKHVGRGLRPRARPWPTNRFRRTTCATASPWTSSVMVLTSRSWCYGWAMRSWNP